MIYILSSAVGLFVLDEKKTLLAHKFFPKDAAQISKNLAELEKGVIIPELKVLLDAHTGDVVTNIPFTSDRKVEYKKDAASAWLQNVRKIAVEKGFGSDSDVAQIMSKVAIEKTKSRMKAGQKKDKIIMQAVSAVDDLTDITNRMSERLHEWYGLYYPEFRSQDNQKYTEEVAQKGYRESFRTFVATTGIDLEKTDVEMLQRHASASTDLFKLREEIESYLEKAMPSVAPNVNAILGPTLAARMILLAGGLERLAKMPASTVQLLGAEKALFRFMKSKEDSRPPKYGIIFNHEMIQRAPQDHKGKAARLLAAKISLASKTDFFIGEDKSEAYRKELNEKMSAIFKR